MTRCTMTTRDVVQFYEADIVGLGMAIPACLIGRWVMPLYVILKFSPRKRDGRKDHWSAYSTEQKSSMTPG